MPLPITRDQFIANMDHEKVTGDKRATMLARYDLMARNDASQSVPGGALGSAEAFGLHAVNQGVLGYLPKISGAVGRGLDAVMGAPDSRQSFSSTTVGRQPDPGTFTQGLLASTRETNPIASIGGDITGAVAPGLSSGVFSAGMKLGEKATASILARSAEQTLLTRAAAATTRNVVAAGAGLTATRLGESRPNEEGYQLSQRLSDAARDVASPFTLLPAGLSGATAARALGSNKGEKAVQALIARLNHTGTPVPADIATNSPEVRGAMDLARATFPEQAEKVKQAFLSDMRASIAKIREGVTGNTGITVPRNPKLIIEKLKGVGPGRVERSAAKAERSSLFGAAKSQVAGNPIGSQAVSDIKVGLDKIVASRSNASDIDAGALQVITDIRRLSQKSVKGSFRVNELIDLKDRAADIAFGSGQGTSGRSIREMSELYTVLNSAVENAAPEVVKASHAAEKLHRVEDALAEMKTPLSDFDEKVAKDFFGGKYPIRRWDELVKRADPNDVSTMKAWMFDQIVSKSTLADGSLSLSKFNSAVKQVNHRVAERVLGTRTLASLRDHIALVDRGNTRETVGGLGGTLAKYASPAALAATATAVLYHPSLAIPTAIGSVGARWLGRKYLKSLLQGNLGGELSRIAGGGAPTIPGAAALAGQRAGGISAIPDLAVGTLQGIGSLGGSPQETTQ